MTTFILFLRGVMPTGKNRVPMAELRQVLSYAGYAGVQTYIQSGNVVVYSDLNQDVLEQEVHQLIQDKIGADITVVARTVARVHEIFLGNPFPQADPAKLYFTFLAALPDPIKITEMLKQNFAPDKLKIIGDVIYTVYATKYSDSKVNNPFFESKLRVRATTRNYNTMKKMCELGAEAEAKKEQK